MSDTIRFIDLAKKLGVGIDTIRRTVAKLGDDLGIVVQRESHSSRAQCLSVDDTDKLIRYFRSEISMSLLQAPVRHRLLIRIMAIFTLSNSYPSFFLSELRLDTLIISKRDYANTKLRHPPLVI